MDFGEAKFVLTSLFNQQLLVVDSIKHDECAYKFHRNSGNKYSGSSCKSLGKNRSITVIDGRIVGRKYLKDDHHDDCLPVSSALVDVIDMNRQMRSEVKTTG